MQLKGYQRQITIIEWAHITRTIFTSSLNYGEKPVKLQFRLEFGWNRNEFSIDFKLRWKHRTLVKWASLTRHRIPAERVVSWFTCLATIYTATMATCCRWIVTDHVRDFAHAISDDGSEMKTELLNRHTIGVITRYSREIGPPVTKRTKGLLTPTCLNIVCWRYVRCGIGIVSIIVTVESALWLLRAWHRLGNYPVDVYRAASCFQGTVVISDFFYKD